MSGESVAAGIPSLTPAEEARAVEIVAADWRLRRILAGREYRVREIGVWHTSRTLEKLGAVLLLSVAEPASLEADWPVIEYDESEASWPPYREARLHYAADKVSELMVMVDLGRGAVVSIEPGVGAETRRGQGNQGWTLYPPLPTTADRGGEIIGLPRSDPENGIYSYEEARALGIPVPPIPAPEERCPPVATPDPGLSPEELDTPAEREQIEQEMATASTCIADPRLALYGVGYSVEAVRAAGSAFEKGRIICAGAPPPLPADIAQDPEALDRFARERLRSAYGVEAGDSLEELVAGCRTTPWGRLALGG